MEAASTIDQVNNLSSQQRSAVLQNMKQQSESQFTQSLITIIVDECTKKCVKPQSKMDSKMTECLTYCVDRFVNTMEIVGKSVSK